MKKRITALLTAAALAAALTAPAAAAEDGTASVIRLARTEGTVSLTNANGRSQKIVEDMRLFNGYELSTQRSGYAYLSLDDERAAKVDQLSVVSVQRSGRKTELRLTSGNLFFNIDEPLAEDETLNIRTSTLVTGIRGTSGVVRTVDETYSEVYIFEGSAMVTSASESSGETVSVVVTPGQMAVSQTAPDSPQPVLTTQPIQAAEIPSFAAEEIRRDESLQAKITERSPLAVSDILEGQADKAQREELEISAKQEALETALAEEHIDVQTVVSLPVEDAASAAENAAGSGGGGGDDDDHVHNYVEYDRTPPTCVSPGVISLRCACGATVTNNSTAPLAPHSWDKGRLANDPSADPTGRYVYTYTCTVCGAERTETLEANQSIDCSTVADPNQLSGLIAEAFQTYANVALTNSGGQIALTSPIEVPNNRTLSLSGAAVSIDAGGAINNYGTLTASVDVAIQDGGSITNAGQLSLDRYLDVKAGGVFQQTGGSLSYANDPTDTAGTFKVSGGDVVPGSNTTKCCAVDASTGAASFSTYANLSGLPNGGTYTVYLPAGLTPDGSSSYLPLPNAVLPLPDNATITLDLGGKAYGVGQVGTVSIPSGTKVTLRDGTLGLQSISARTYNFELVRIQSGGTLTLENAALNADNYYAVYCEDGGTFNRGSGTVEGYMYPNDYLVQANLNDLTTALGPTYPSRVIVCNTDTSGTKLQVVNLEVPAGKTVLFKANSTFTGTTTVNAGGTLEICSDSDTAGPDASTINNSGTIIVNAPGNSEFYNKGILNNLEGGLFTVQDWEFVNASGGTFSNSGRVEVSASGTFQNYGACESGGTFLNEGTFQMGNSTSSSATFTNNGTFTNSRSGTVTNYGKFYNGDTTTTDSTSAVLTNRGQITNSFEFYNYHTVDNYYTISNDCVLHNGIQNNLDNTATFTNYPGSVLINTDRVFNYYTFINDGRVMNENPAQFTNGGSITPDPVIGTNWTGNLPVPGSTSP